MSFLNLGRFEVSGKSMLPSFKPGDRVVTRSFSEYSLGDVVVANISGKTVIKRIVTASGLKYSLMGDNVDHSSKYRIKDGKNILGKVIFKY